MRNTIRWKNIFKLLQNEKYAYIIIDAIICAKNNIKLNKHELECIHYTYDCRILYQAIGHLIRGNNSDNVKVFTDIVYKYWDILDIYLNMEIIDIVDNNYQK